LVRGEQMRHSLPAGRQVPNESQRKVGIPISLSANIRTNGPNKTSNIIQQKLPLSTLIILQILLYASGGYRSFGGRRYNLFELIRSVGNIARRPDSLFSGSSVRLNLDMPFFIQAYVQIFY